MFENVDSKGKEKYKKENLLGLNKFEKGFTWGYDTNKQRRIAILFKVRKGLFPNNCGKFHGTLACRRNPNRIKISGHEIIKKKLH